MSTFKFMSTPGLMQTVEAEVATPGYDGLDLTGGTVYVVQESVRSPRRSAFCCCLRVSTGLFSLPPGVLPTVVLHIP